MLQNALLKNLPKLLLMLLLTRKSTMENVKFHVRLSKKSHAALTRRTQARVWREMHYQS